MIFLICRQRDEGLSLNMIENKARDAFPRPVNTTYFDAIAQRKNENARADSFFALCLLSSLCDRLGVDKASLSLCRDESGRPFFKDSRLDFSISHSSGTVAVALSDLSCVGIDLELSPITQKHANELAKRYFAPEEVKIVKEGLIGGENLGEIEAFRYIWTEKEAYTKMSGIPLSHVLSSTDTPKGFVRHISVGEITLALCSSGEDEIKII